MSDLLNPKILIENTYLSSILVLFLTMYGPRLHINLPKSLQNLFNNKIFNFIIIFLIAFTSFKNFKASLTMTVVFLVFMDIVNSSQFFKMIGAESFNNFGPPVAKCSNYSNLSIKNVNTPFYPLNGEDSENSANF